jgi:hypothetical protein
MRHARRFGIIIAIVCALSAISTSIAADVDELLRLEQYRGTPAPAPPPPVVPAAAVPVEEPGLLYAYG